MAARGTTCNNCLVIVLAYSMSSTVDTIFEFSILVEGQTFQVNLTPSLSSFWLIKSPHVAILKLPCKVCGSRYTQHSCQDESVRKTINL